MGTYIVLVVLGIIIVAAIINSTKHFKGEGGCCGGSCDKKVKKKKIKKVVKILEINIDGMSCDNCKRKIENHLNSLEMVNAKVNLKNSKAIVRLGEGIKDDLIVSTIETLGYKVVAVKELN